MNKYLYYLMHPTDLILSLSKHGFLPFLSDRKYIELQFKQKMGYKLDLDNPKTLNEKIQWLKLYNRNPEYSKMADKYEAKNYIANIIGNEYIIPTLGVWDSFEEIDFDSLPDQFVLKTTHDCGGVVICKDKNTFDVNMAREKLNRSLKTNFYMLYREWVYKNIKRRIIAEQYMVDESGKELKDYKIFCFNGKPEYVEVDFNRSIRHKLNPYDFDWNPLNFCDSSPNDYSANISKPLRLNEMKEIAEILSKDIPLLRVDFYSINDKIYVGELTFYPGAGYIKFNPKETDRKYGDMLNLEGYGNENL